MFHSRVHSQSTWNRLNEGFVRQQKHEKHEETNAKALQDRLMDHSLEGLSKIHH